MTHSSHKLFTSALCRQLTNQEENPLENLGKTRLVGISEAYRISGIRVVSIASRCHE